jgi:hypothetical protein
LCCVAVAVTLQRGQARSHDATSQKIISSVESTPMLDTKQLSGNFVVGDASISPALAKHMTAFLEQPKIAVSTGGTDRTVVQLAYRGFTLMVARYAKGSEASDLENLMESAQWVRGFMSRINPDDAMQLGLELAYVLMFVSERFGNDAHLDWMVEALQKPPARIHAIAYIWTSLLCKGCPLNIPIEELREGAFAQADADLIREKLPWEWLASTMNKGQPHLSDLAALRQHLNDGKLDKDTYDIVATIIYTQVSDAWELLRDDAYTQEFMPRQYSQKKKTVERFGRDS